MSALADRLHSLLSRFASIGRADVEQVVSAAEEHFAPLIEQARAELLADIKAQYNEARMDGEKFAAYLAAEVVKVLGHTPVQPTLAPAPVEPPAPQA